eukprot:6182855-Pleurochrysis_carterae.AAC.1
MATCFQAIDVLGAFSLFPCVIWAIATPCMPVFLCTWCHDARAVRLGFTVTPFTFHTYFPGFYCIVRHLVELASIAKQEPDLCSSRCVDTVDALFRYNTLLKLYSSETLEPERLVLQSFYAHQRTRHEPSVQAELDELKSLADSLRTPHAARVAELFSRHAECAALRKKLNDWGMRPRYILRYLQPGRLLRIIDGTTDYGWAVLLGFRHELNRPIRADAETLEAQTAHDYIVDVLLPCAKDSHGSTTASTTASTHTGTAQASAVRAVPASAADAAARVVGVRLSAVRAVSAVRLWLPSDLRSASSLKRALAALREARAHSYVTRVTSCTSSYFALLNERSRILMMGVCIKLSSQRLHRRALDSRD